MGVKVNYSYLSKIDLQDIYNYIKKDSPFYAKREISLIRKAINSIKLNVFIGTKFKKFDDELIRVIVFKNYQIIYEITNGETQIEIITIHHHSRSLSKNPAFTEED